MTKYLSVPTDTIKGIKKAERLVARGWKIYHTGLFHVKLLKR
jgi:hypothetical protein